MTIKLDDIKALILSVVEDADVDLLELDTPFSEAAIDSLEEFNIFLEVEERYGVAVPDDKAEEIKTIGQLIKFVEENR